MIVQTGFLRDNRPIVEIGLYGVYHAAEPKKVNAVIDTGFNGFISMSLFAAFPLGLPLAGTTPVTLADGNSQPVLIAEAFAVVGGRLPRKGLVLLGPKAKDVLLGIEFLKTFELALVVTKNDVLLIDENDLEKATLKTEDNPNGK